MSQQWLQLARDAGEHHWSYEQFLYQLAQEECLQRLQNRIARYTKGSKLPAGKSLASFQFDATPSINRAQITALVQNPIWVHQAEHVLLFGPSGTGKTHLAVMGSLNKVSGFYSPIQLISFNRCNELVKNTGYLPCWISWPESLCSSWMKSVM